jgi:transcriptional regulator with GAF, ATPase, and Fis domain
MPKPLQIVGLDRGLRGVFERASMVAPADLPVLLFGETGTGKEVVAREIHDRSKRAAGPFWRVNCGALAPELVDSELFGHERGAFTGALAERKGWFELAHDGTLFLDEVAELTPAVQVRLLRVLQEGELVRVGGTRPIRVDVRIVAATHRDLAGMVEAREFREDLYYRISAFPIVIPPLRERGEDIADLAVYFAGRAARRFGLRPVTPTSADLATLRGYPWPGNVRELATVIDRAVLLGEGTILAVDRALGLSVRPAIAPAGEIEPLDTVMRRTLERALTITQGRIDGPFGAAKKLAINPHTLRARLKKLGIDWTRFR